jgi:hypothetical protein
VIAALDAGDVFLVTRLDRLARSTRDLLNVLSLITEKKADFRSLSDPWADTMTAHGRLMLTVLGGLAEFERELIRARTGEGPGTRKGERREAWPQAQAHPEAIRKLLARHSMPSPTNRAHGKFQGPITGYKSRSTCIVGRLCSDLLKRGKSRLSGLGQKWRSLDHLGVSDAEHLNRQAGCQLQDPTWLSAS